ncbi:hypothetical protein HOE04_04070 [archaeon]|nr:hypothetical protein [archaeon]
MTKLNTLKFGLAGGITTALCVALITIAGIFNYCPECTSLISGIYGSLGYSVSWLGVLLGAIYGFIDMFIGTFVFAWIYNKLL